VCVWRLTWPEASRISARAKINLYGHMVPAVYDAAALAPFTPEI
jgi:hypothetical protein